MAPLNTRDLNTFLLSVAEAFLVVSLGLLSCPYTVETHRLLNICITVISEASVIPCYDIERSESIIIISLLSLTGLLSLYEEH